MNPFSFGSLSNGGAGLPAGSGGTGFGSYLTAGTELANAAGLGESQPSSAFAVSDSGAVNVTVGGFSVPDREHKTRNVPAGPFQYASYSPSGTLASLTDPETFSGRVTIGVTVAVVAGAILIAIKK